MFTAPCNGSGGQAAKVCALQILSDTVDHRLGLVFLEARCRTLKAGSSTFITCAKAFDFLLTQHLKLLTVLPGIRLLINTVVVPAVCFSAHSGRRKQAPEVEGGCTLAFKPEGQRPFSWRSEASRWRGPSDVVPCFLALAGRECAVAHRLWI